MTDKAAQVRKAAEAYFGVALDDESLERFEVTALKGGDWLFRQGDDGNSLFLLVRGRLQVLLKQADDQEPRLLGEVVPGESVGEVGLLSGDRRSAGVRAIRDSLLIRMDRDAFESLSLKHPALVMKLAAHVAGLLQRSSAAGKAPARQMHTITLLPLHGGERVTAFCRELVEQLGGFGKTLDLAAGELLAAGAPRELADDGQKIPDDLQYWLHRQETRNRFLVYRCAAGDSAWTRFAMRQSDLVVYIADARNDRGLSEWESRLRSGRGVAAGRQALVLLQGDSSQAISGTAGWLEQRPVDFHLHVRRDKADDTARVARIVSGNALGLVLGAGGARGFAHLGVYKALLDLGIQADWVGGVSIGSIFGSPIASDWPFDKAYRVARHSFVKVKPFSDYTLPLAGLIRGRRMERELEVHQDYRIEDMPIPFFCISSTLDTGETLLHESGKLATALRASASLPGVLPPAVYNKRLVIDGAVLNSLPVDIMLQKPVGRIIAVDMSSDKSYEIGYDSIPPAWRILAGRYLPFFRRYRVPSLSTTMLKATEIGTLARVRAAGEQADLLLRPPVRKFGLTEVKSFEKIMDSGYDYALKELGDWWQNENKKEI